MWFVGFPFNIKTMHWIIIFLKLAHITFDNIAMYYIDNNWWFVKELRENGDICFQTGILPSKTLKLRN